MKHSLKNALQHGLMLQLEYTEGVGIVITGRGEIAGRKFHARKILSRELLSVTSDQIDAIRTEMVKISENYLLACRVD